MNQNFPILYLIITCKVSRKKVGYLMRSKDKATSLNARISKLLKCSTFLDAFIYPLGTAYYTYTHLNLIAYKRWVVVKNELLAGM